MWHLKIFQICQEKKFTLAKKNLHEYIRGVRDKYQVWSLVKAWKHELVLCAIMSKLKLSEKYIYNIVYDMAAQADPSKAK